MSALFKKLNLKDQKSIHILNTPQEFKYFMEELPAEISIREELLDEEVEFLLVFVKSKEELSNFAFQYGKNLEGDCVFWVAYPKKSSKRYSSDLTRDDGWQPVGDLGFEGVRMVAIDEDWSALRLRNAMCIKSLTRNPKMAISDIGRKKLRENGS